MSAAGAQHKRIRDLELEVTVLNERIKGLRGLSTPGLVVAALEEIQATAAQGLAAAEQQVLFWRTVRDWSAKLAGEEREDWGDLL